MPTITWTAAHEAWWSHARQPASGGAYPCGETLGNAISSRYRPAWRHDPERRAAVKLLRPELCRAVAYLRVHHIHASAASWISRRPVRSQGERGRGAPTAGHRL